MTKNSERQTRSWMKPVFFLFLLFYTLKATCLCSSSIMTEQSEGENAPKAGTGTPLKEQSEQQQHQQPHKTLKRPTIHAVSTYKSLCDALRDSDEDEKVCLAPIVKKKTDIAWQVVIWMFVLIVLPATIVPIINYASQNGPISVAEFSVEIIVLVIGFIVMVVGIVKVFCKDCQ